MPKWYQQGLRVNNKLWLISDTHFGHRNIVKFQQRPESHEVIMLSEWIKRVGEDDQILHLGDVWMKGSPWRWAAVISRLPGQKFLIKGNHDKDRDDTYESAGFTIVEEFGLDNGYVFTHRPVTTLFLGPTEKWGGWHTNIHGHTHGNPHHPEDGDPLEGKNYINVCVELTELAPVQLGNVWKRS
ncbi:MAG: metallophosphoesterase [Patescibacteria group bacterium]|nr:metallophosphoesterase [Patescibacteria group bacterium]